jgi:hypothetical protein
MFRFKFRAHRSAILRILRGLPHYLQADVTLEYENRPQTLLLFHYSLSLSNSCSCKSIFLKLIQLYVNYEISQEFYVNGQE